MAGLRSLYPSVPVRVTCRPSWPRIRTDGDVVVEEVSNSFFGNDKKPTVVIGPGSRVEGALILKREVKLYISDRAEVGSVEGIMSMDDAVRFRGDRP